MISFIFGIILGAFIGWNIKQPEWAKKIQQDIKEYFK